MPNLERKTIIGHIGREPVMKDVNGKGSIATFSVAVNHYSKNDDAESGFDKITKWHNVTAFGFAAESVKDASKGQLVMVDGEMKYKNYVGKDGEQKVSESLNAGKIIVFYKHGGNPSQDKQTQTKTSEKMYQDRKMDYNNSLDDEIPF